MGFERPTPIQEQAYSVVRSGRDVVGIAQTGTGKTLGLPDAHSLRTEVFYRHQSQSPDPGSHARTRLAVGIQPGRKSHLINRPGDRSLCGANINVQKKAVAEGADIIVATPGRLNDLALNRSLQLKIGEEAGDR